MKSKKSYIMRVWFNGGSTLTMADAGMHFTSIREAKRTARDFMYGYHFQEEGNQSKVSIYVYEDGYETTDPLCVLQCEGKSKPFWITNK